MTLLIDLDLVKAIAAGDSNIQDYEENSHAVVMAFEMAEIMGDVGVFGRMTKFAQAYFAAHVLSLSKTDPGGRGPLSSETIGDVSVSYTLPYLNQTTVLGSTQYGLQFLELRKQMIPAFMSVSPSV